MELSSPVLEATLARLQARFGAGVAPWWARLPEALAGLAARWELRLGEPVGRGNTSLVLRCRRADGRPAVLKLTPDARLAEAEALALRGWAPSGRVPAVWGFDPAAGAVLLEAIADETPLSERPELRVGLDEVAALIGALHASGDPAAAAGESLAGRVEFIFGHWIGRHRANPAVTRVVPMARLERGRALARELAAGGPAPVLLHGDLHPGNVLHGGPARGLVAIDPRPCLGDAAADAVDWVFWAAEPGRWRPRCRDLAADLGVDPERLWGWCRAFAAMAAASTATHGGPPERVAALLALAP